MFTPLLDKKNATPLYEQLYRYIRQEILCHSLQPGDKLPSKRKLANHLKISQNTIENAYQQLIAEGYIRAIPKKGFFVEEIAESLTGLPIPEKPLESIHPPQVSPIPVSHYRYDFKTNIVNTDYFPFDTWSKMMRYVLSMHQETLLKPLPFQGDLSLRQEIAHYLHAYRGIQTTPAQIIVGAGSEYLLSLLIQLLGTEHTFALENPGYEKIHRVFQNHNLKICYIDTTLQSLDMDSLSLSNADILHITPSHHFPLGCVMPIQTRRKVLNWVYEKENRYIIEDDYDSEFRFSGKPIPALQSLDLNEKVIYLNTFTKSLAPSLRISYMVLPPTLMDKFTQQFSRYSTTVPSFEQSTLAMFMAKGNFERHINKMKRIYKEQRDTLIQAIQCHSLGKSIQILGEDTGLHLLLQINIGLTEEELVEIAKQQQIHIFGLSQYFHKNKTTAKIPDSTIILGYSGLSPQDILQGITKLLNSWQQYLEKC